MVTLMVKHIFLLYQKFSIVYGRITPRAAINAVT